MFTTLSVFHVDHDVLSVMKCKKCEGIRVPHIVDTEYTCKLDSTVTCSSGTIILAKKLAGI